MRLESSAYWVTFIAAFLAVAIWESGRPLRPLISAAGRRWSNHAILLAACFLCTGLMLRVTPVFVASAAQDSPYGLLNHAWIPMWLRFVVTLLALDFLHYGIHRLFHSVYFLWRIHEVHHSDRDFDVSTAARFHPLEVLITQGIYLGGIVLLAPPAAAVLVAEMLVIAENLFVHANQSLPARVERILRQVVVTPDLHRIHHSEEFLEQNRNFGQFFPWWDRLLRTYAATPVRGTDGLVIGVKELGSTDTMPVPYMLTEPFHRTVDPV